MDEEGFVFVAQLHVHVLFYRFLCVHDCVYDNLIAWIFKMHAWNNSFVKVFSTEPNCTYVAFCNKCIVTRL